ncbi:MAG: class I SAM-dependent methyltransferase [Thermodesulfobacteriota bacterium]|nr:class I SAM-dependent methyltransferase [Thermodesulfobacteriota bacterium]
MILQSSPNEPTFFEDDFPLHWQMTRWEKYAFLMLLERSRPEVALEIGTYKGGSLQALARKVQKVYTIDINEDSKRNLGNIFPNVHFYTGESKTLIPEVLKNIEHKNEELGFVLIDGDHSTEGVRNDINAVLKYIPKRPLYIVFHDSFFPLCRVGILEADWQECKHVHYLEVDFIPGVFHFKAFDTAKPKSMYGGLALALMLPEKRKEPLIVHQSQKGLFDSVFKISRHARYYRLKKILKSIKRKIRR